MRTRGQMPVAETVGGGGRDRGHGEASHAPCREVPCRVTNSEQDRSTNHCGTRPQLPVADSRGQSMPGASEKCEATQGSSRRRRGSAARSCSPRKSWVCTRIVLQPKRSPSSRASLRGSIEDCIRHLLGQRQSVTRRQPNKSRRLPGWPTPVPVCRAEGRSRSTGRGSSLRNRVSQGENGLRKRRPHLGDARTTCVDERRTAKPAGRPDRGGRRV